MYTSRSLDVSLRGVKWYALPNCHCEAPRGPWQSRSTRWDNRKAPAKTQLPSRDCTPRALPRASRSGRHVALRPPRNDKLGSLAPQNVCRSHCQPARRSGSAATGSFENPCKKRPHPIGWGRLHFDSADDKARGSFGKMGLVPAVCDLHLQRMGKINRK